MLKLYKINTFHKKNLIYNTVKFILTKSVWKLFVFFNIFLWGPNTLLFFEKDIFLR